MLVSNINKLSGTRGTELDWNFAVISTQRPSCYTFDCIVRVDHLNDIRTKDFYDAFGEEYANNMIDDNRLANSNYKYVFISVSRNGRHLEPLSLYLMSDHQFKIRMQHVKDEKPDVCTLEYFTEFSYSNFINYIYRYNKRVGVSDIDVSRVLRKPSGYYRSEFKN